MLLLNDTWSGDQISKSELKSAYRQREFSYMLAENDFAFIDSLEQSAGHWKNILLKSDKRNYLKEMDNPQDGWISLQIAENLVNGRLKIR